MASIDLNLKAGVYKIKYAYDGDLNTSSFTGQSKITVKKTSSVSINKISSNIFRNKETSYFQVKIKDIRSNPIKNAKVIFKINKKNYIKKTDSNGIATVKFKLKTANYLFKVTFPKTKNFKKNTKTYTVKVKPKQARNNGFWLRATDMFDVNFKTLQKYGTRHIFLNAKAIESYGKKTVEKFIKQAKSHKIKVHIWMQVFYYGKWLNPVKNGKINYDLISSKIKLAKNYAKLKNVGGIHFDYLRYPGTAYKYKNSVKAINYFTKNAVKSIHKISKKIIVSAAVMPEPSSMKKYYGQDIPTLGKYLDAIVPMVYKGNYNAGSSWIKFVTKTFVSQSKHAKIWTGLQCYKSDNKINKLSAGELMGDADAAALAGASGVILFRFGLLNYINFNDV